MKTRRKLRWRKEKSRRKDERIARPERQIMLATRIMHINQYFFTLLSQKSSCMAKMDAFRSSTSRRFYSSMSQALCSVPASKTPVTNIYHLSKSRKDNQWVQLKRMLIKGPVPTPYTVVQHSFRLTFRKRRMVSSLLLFISRAWDVLVLLIFPHDYICAFLIV